MPRPKRCRRVCEMPMIDGFFPEGCAQQGEVTMSIDEYEVIRLVDLEGLTHEQTAIQMEISRSTVTEVYECARYKLADALIN